MTGIFETIKKIYTDKNTTSKHLILYGLCLVYIFLTTLFDIKFGNFNTSKRNPIDMIFSILILLYSIQFITNSLNKNTDFIPSINQINWKNLIPLFIINFVWGTYILIFLILWTVLFLTLHHSVYLLYIGFIFFILIAPLFYFVYIALADNIALNKLLNLLLVFKFAKVAFIPFWKQVLKNGFISLIILAIYLIIYLIGASFNLDNIFLISKNFALYDLFMYTVILYCLAIISLFVFPYTILETYTEKIRPIFGNEHPQERLTE